MNFRLPKCCRRSGRALSRWNAPRRIGRRGASSSGIDDPAAHHMRRRRARGAVGAQRPLQFADRGIFDHRRRADVADRLGAGRNRRHCSSRPRAPGRPIARANSVARSGWSCWQRALPRSSSAAGRGDRSAPVPSQNQQGIGDKETNMADYRNVKADKLTDVVRSIVKAGGSSDREAELVSTNLVEANLKGHDLHGVGMIPRYIDSMKEDGLTVNAHVSVVMDAGVMLTLDGNQGYGQVMGYEAMELGAERARRTRRLRARAVERAPHRAHRPLGGAVHRSRPGVDPLRQCALAAHRRAVRRRRRSPRHQPVLRRHSPARQRPHRARLRHQHDRPGQDPGCAQQAR